jgi:Fe-S-cluster-containing hydrogenase component 2
MCATFCPTGALVKFEDAGGAFGIEHAPGDCVKCRCCVDICPAQAISISDEVFAVDLLSGATERYIMAPLEHPPGDPHSILHAMKDLLGEEQVYER